jgi:hypothetical protein
MGHPQPPTPLFCDNEVAIKLNLKMSKSLDMRFHWFRDGVWQGYFRIIFVPGKIDVAVADFFTKVLPVARHCTLTPFFTIDPDDTIFSLTLSLHLTSYITLTLTLTLTHYALSLSYDACMLSLGVCYYNCSHIIILDNT